MIEELRQKAGGHRRLRMQAADKIERLEAELDWWKSSFEAANEYADDLKKALMHITITSDVDKIGRIAEAALCDDDFGKPDEPEHIRKRFED